MTWAVVVQGTLLALGCGLLVARAGWRDATARRRAARLVHLRDVFERAARGDPVMAAERRALAREPFGRLVDVIAGLAVGLEGARRERLAALAADVGVLTAAHRRCTARRAWRRLTGARVLTLLGTGGPTLVALLDDPDAEVRAEAARGLSGDPRADAIARLLLMLGDPAPLARFAAKDSLLRLRGPVVAPLAQHLERVPPGAADPALEVAAALAEPRLLGPALARRGETSPGTRARVVAVLAAIGGEEAVAALDEMLVDESADVRAVAARGLGALGHWPAAPRLAAALRDPAWNVRRGAGLALRELGAPGVLVLRRSLDDRDRFAKDMARQVLDLAGRP